MQRWQLRAHAGMTLIFVIAMLALMSVLSVSFAGMAQVERQLGGNYVFHVRAKLAAESGMAWAHARLMDLAPNAIDDVNAIPALTGNTAIGTEYVSVVESAGAVDSVTRVTVEDESAKLNLNNASGPGHWQAVEILLSHCLQDATLAVAVIGTLRDSPDFGCNAYPGGKFPSMSEVDRALRKSGVSEAGIAAAHRCLTVDSWMDPDVVGFDARCAAGVRYSEITPDSPADAEICKVSGELRSQRIEMAPRAPVNVNAAPMELLQAMIQPLRGVYLDERGKGPENRSTDHYGWASAGQEDNQGVGVIRWTDPFTSDQAERLARAMHDRIHGVANPDLANGLVEGPVGWADGLEHRHDDAIPFFSTGDRFETWDEFREFLERGLTDDAWLAIFVGESGRVRDGDEVVTPFCQTAGFVDPHGILSPLTGDSNTTYYTYYRGVPGRLWDATGQQETYWDTSNVVDWWDRYYARARMDLLLAMFNPNTQLNDFNPNQNLFLMVDKPQVTVGTTELCFDSTGVFSVTSRGLCLRRDSLTMEPVEVGAFPASDCLARHEIQATVRAFDMFRLTTQAQLLKGLQVSGPDKPSNVSEYFSQVANHGGSVEVAKGPGGRFALQAYPQPLLSGREDEIAAVFQDGYLMPATLETQSSYPGKTFLCSFNGDTDQPLDPDVTTAAPGIGSGRQWHASDHNFMNSESLWKTEMDAPSGAVYPDGVYCEEQRVYALKMLHFYNPQFPLWQCKVGTLAFWIKPGFHTGIPTRIRKILAGPSQRGYFSKQQFASLYFLPNAASNEAIGRSNLNATAPLSHRCADMSVNGIYHSQTARNYWVPTRSLAFGFAWQRPSASISMATYRDTFLLGMVTSPTVTQDFSLANNLSAAAAPGDFTNLHRYAMPGRQWTLIQVGWDVSSATPRVSLGLGFNSCLSHAGNINRFIVDHPYRSQSNPTAASNWDFQDEWLRFGELAKEDTGAAGAGSQYFADSTIDEIFGLSEPSGSPWTSLLASNLVNRGRYLCKQVLAPMGTNYVAWYKTPVTDVCAALGVHTGTVRLRSVAWTLYRPRNNRDPNIGLCNTVSSLVVNPNDKPDPTQQLWQPDHGVNDFQAVRQAVWDPISVDIREPGAAASWYFESHNLWASRLTYPGGSEPPAGAPVAYRPGDAFQLKLNFHYNESSQRVYEPPVLDDITCTFALPRVEILRWREE